MWARNFLGPISRGSEAWGGPYSHPDGLLAYYSFPEQERKKKGKQCRRQTSKEWAEEEERATEKGRPFYERRQDQEWELGSGHAATTAMTTSTSLTFYYYPVDRAENLTNLSRSPNPHLDPQLAITICLLYPLQRAQYPGNILQSQIHTDGQNLLRFKFEKAMFLFTKSKSW